MTSDLHLMRQSDRARVRRTHAKRSSLKGNRDTRRARLPRQQPPGRHGIVSPNRNQKEPAMPASKPVQSRPPASGNTSNSFKAARPAARKSRPRHGTSSRVRIAHIMGDERTTRRPRARERRLLRVLIIHGRNRKNPITRPSITSLPARCSTDLRSRETAIDTQDEKRLTIRPDITWTAAHAAIRYSPARSPSS